ncbi:MAG: hypothetical protein WBA12_01295, partial [Catalinimonas sp.]
GVLNPLRFDFDEITDRVPPVFRRFAVRPLGIDARLGGTFDDLEAVPLRRGSRYFYQRPVEAWGTLGVEIDVYDQHDGSYNRNGVQCVEVKVDGREVYYHHLDRFTYDRTRDINVHVNYEVWQEKNHRYQRCYVADGNELPIYRTGPERGRIRIDEERDYEVEITCWDTYQNAATLTLQLRGRRPDGVISPTVDPNQAPRFEYARFGNILRLTAHDLPVEARPAVAYAGAEALVLPATYAQGEATVYLHDLRRGVPDSVDFAGQNFNLPYRAMLLPDAPLTYRTDDLALSIPAGALFDTLFLEADANGEHLHFGPDVEPVSGTMDVTWYPHTPADRAKTHVYRQAGRSRAFEGGEWRADGAVRFKTRHFGRFVLATDDTPPTIRLRRADRGGAEFRIHDDLSGIKSYRATLGGEWLLMNYDYKQARLWSETRRPGAALRGELVLEVTDQAGNSTLYRQTIQ